MATAESKGVLTRYNVKSLEELDQKIEELLQKNQQEEIFIWFVGSVENGVSWCSDCRTSEPVVENYLENLKLKLDCSLIICTVDKAPFKSPNSPYMKHKAKVKKVPTIIWWGKPERVEESECMDTEMLALVFEKVKE
ncbi:thioredoxin domain-containing protein 17 [Cimex lectularius]|uniref:Thioredoxin domain-containing protein 17 n=1 Tax=Cimex lectularius TaxID=79782 RepID=A0A8I6RMH6_CIMLE|nr:thioredoxin domain-containing protein 17 [Cimex lectularius]